MMFGDTTRIGIPFSKDPHVVKFKNDYIMYYSIPPRKDDVNSGWNIGIAKSKNLTDWKTIGEITPQADYEAKGLCAPGALVRNDTIHLFYQTYGNGAKDAICHAFSTDGVNFTRNNTNPIFSPSGDWNCGRAIDAEVILFNNKYFLYFASRTPDYQIQIQGVATAPTGTQFDKEDWTQACDKAILEPKYPWEGKCVEGASVIQVGNELVMFYAGAYNNDPQQIGVAKSKDGINWEKLSNKPFLTNGDKGSWNYCESGHPHIFRDPDTKRTYLFYQGNNDYGKTWLLSQKEVFWKDGEPYFK
ncbi:family 43 glycosylhydrolase [Dysgonomonas sp. Marseille-P4677]|uniref:family 43 glycosylhydrolase n=1 Tax=Dysgonomonas sp. Marseille-P4677 TaxID=2364790 RepID=UPI00351C367F